MGKRGPKPTPTPILVRRGSWLADTRKGEPAAPEGTPECPDWIANDAKKVWAWLIPKLDLMGVLSVIDRYALVRYCVTCARWRRVAKTLASMADETYEHETKSGATRQLCPEVVLEAKLATGLLRLEQEFGLTPSSRTGIDVRTPPKAEGMARFFARKPLRMRPEPAASKPVKKARRRKPAAKRKVKRDATGRFARVG